MLRDGFLRFCNDPEIACCKAERELEQLRTENASLREQLAESQRRGQAAVEDMTAVLKRDSDDICAYCKNRIECKGEKCERFEQGKGGTIDGKEYPDRKWTCMNFDYGTCFLLADTPCNGCFENDCSGFEWRGQEAGR